MLVGHSMQFVEAFANDFARYRQGEGNFHPSLVSAFQRFEKHFGTAFKHRHFIEANHRLHTGIFGDPLLAMLRNREKGLPMAPPVIPTEPRKTFYSIPRTLH